MVLTAQTVLPPEETEKTKIQLTKERTERWTKPRIEDFELADIDFSPSGLNVAMYKNGYIRRNRGWELGPKAQSRAGVIKAASEPESELEPPVMATVTTPGTIMPPSSIAPPAPPKQPNTAVPSVADTSVGLEDLKVQMRDIAIGLGISQKQAASMANFLASSFDVQNPEALWAGLTEVSEIHPSMRKRFWRTWNSYTGAGIPSELSEKVEQQTNSAMGRKEPEAPGLKKRYIAVDGEVLDCDADDDSGMSFSQALQLARLQNDKHAVDMGGAVSEKESTLSTALTILSQNNQAHTAALVEVFKGNGNGAGNNELMLQLISAKSEAAEARTASLITQSNQTVAAALGQLAEAMKLIAGGQQTRKSWLEEMFTEVPEAREKFFKGVFGGGDSGGSVRIQMPGSTGPDGQPMGVPLDAYMRLEEISSRKEMVKTFREGLPDVMKIGTRLVEALNTNAQAQKIAAEKGISLEQPALEQPVQPVGQPATEPPTNQPVQPVQQFDPATMNQIECPGCKATLAYPKTAQSFGCPECDSVIENPNVPSTNGADTSTPTPTYDPRANPTRRRSPPIIRPTINGKF